MGLAELALIINRGNITANIHALQEKCNRLLILFICASERNYFRHCLIRETM